MSVEPPVALGLATALGALVLQRLSELMISSAHQKTLAARGAVEFGRRQFPGFVALHVLMPLALVAEVVAGGARPGPAWPWLLGLLAIAALLRAASIRALGDRWHVRVWVVPGEARQTHGIYRWLAHPNYVAVVLEMAALPLLFGAWRTAIAASAFNAMMLALRVRIEERALRWASEQPAHSG